jgi:hypothetical protein
MSKDIGIVVALPPALKEWVDAQAEDIGVNAAIWIRMLVVAAAKGRNALPQGPIAFRPAMETPRVPRFQIGTTELPEGDPAADVDLDVWRGPVEDEQGEGQASGVDVDAMIAGHVAAAEVSNVMRMPPIETFGPPPPSAAVIGLVGGSGVRSLRRPAPAYSPAMQPSHLRGL